VRGVPKTVINNRFQIVGAAPQDDFIYRLATALGIGHPNAEESPGGIPADEQ
jgi:hypothetical protein